MLLLLVRETEALDGSLGDVSRENEQRRKEKSCQEGP